MATTNPQELTGLLDQLGLGAINEAQAHQAGMGQGIRTNQTEAGQFAAIGQELGRGTGRAARGLFEAVRGAKGEGEFSFHQGVQNVDDAIIARGAGIAGGAKEVQSRRKIRKAITEQDFGDLSKIESQIKVAEFVAEQAQKDGNATAQAAALTKIASLKREKLQDDKLKATTQSAQAQAIEEGTVEVVLDGEDKARTAQWARRDNTIGVEYTDDNNNIQFVPTGKFKKHERTLAGSTPRVETIGTAIARNTSSKEIEKLRGLVSTGVESARKMGRVMDTIIDLDIMDNIDQVMSTSGDVSTALSQITRNAKGILKTAGSVVGVGRAKDSSPQAVRENADGTSGTWSGIDFWTSADGVAADPDHAVWDFITLPPEIEQNAAAAQNYRAQIMELMYMAARLAEPSNRGLSDNDIINAAKRLGGTTANPALMMRRFAEMLHDSAATLETELDIYYGAVEFENFPVPAGMTKREVFEAFIGNKGLIQYRQDLKDLREKHQFKIDDTTGRATFESPIDADVNPLDAETPADITEMSSEDALSLIPDAG